MRLLLAYDNLNRLVLFTADDGTSSQYDYDARGNLTSRTDPNGTTVSHTYDATHRRVETNVSPATGVVGTTRQVFEYDGLSRLTLATDNNDPSDSTDDVRVVFLYDSLSRVIEEGQQVGDGTGVELFTTDFGWLAADLLTDLVYPGGRHIQYGYDGADRFVSVGDMDSGRTEGASYEYFGLGRVHTRDLNNGARSTRLDDAGTTDIGFDGVGRTTLLRHLHPVDGTLLAGFEYRYDAVSNRTSHRRLHHQDPTGGDFKGEVYAYDSADRLVSFQEGFLDSDHGLSSPPDDSHTWILDGAGNWSEMTRNGVDYLATPNNLNEYDEPQSGGTRVDDGVPDDFLDDASTSDPDGLNLAHDRNGNQVDIGLFGIGYDFLNRPVQALRHSDSMPVARYTYDALGRRVGRQVTNSGSLDETLRYHHALGSRIEARDGTGAIVRQVVFGHGLGERLWQIRGSGGPTLQSEYFLEDTLGSTAALAAGTGPTVVERVTYDAYGKPTFETPGNIPLTDVLGNFIPRSLFGNPDLFRGMLYDPELGIRTNDANTDSVGLMVASIPEVIGFGALSGQAESGIPVDVPGWGDRGESDPGSTLLELFPFLTETMLYRSNGVPEPDTLEFLSLAGRGSGGGGGFTVYYNPNQGRCLSRDPSGLLPDTLLFGNRYGLFANNPVKSFLEIGRRHSNRTTIANRAEPYEGGTTPPPPSDPPP